MTIAERVTNLIFIDGIVDEKQKKLIDLIVNLTQEKLMALLPKEIKEIPKELEFIVVEIAVKRYNRIGSEGMTSETVEGHSINFSTSDFDEYADFIDKFIEELDEDFKNKKVVRFL
ncbi:phage head-tail connector protein [Peptoniphilus raoultii]|uniref:phage head-tail connector protein n=1 Tax=Peptoniphilus raoultii TaxID=1776387 RepID=UPI0008D9D418|nr:phage head-tail connector protein [Peptoniphilus raoultii]